VRTMPGNEGMNISKGTIILMTFMILLITTASAAVAYTVGVKTTVDRIDCDLTDVKQTLKEMQPQITENEKDVAVIMAHYESIDLNIEDIKEQLRSR